MRPRPWFPAASAAMRMGYGRASPRSEHQRASNSFETGPFPYGDITVF